MNDLQRLLRSLTLRQRILIAAAAVLVVGGLATLQRWQRERDLKPLFSGLAPEDASAVVGRLRERAVPYELRNGGGTIVVPSARVDELRIELAGAGLPRSGRIGYELFDKTSFGATEFAEQVNFHRALEGELERSIMALAEVEHARVHLTQPKDSVFLESRRPAKASVMVKLRPGATLSEHNVAAICHLMASAVEGLQPEAVTVVDMRGNLLSRPRRPMDAGGAETSEGMIEFRQKIERDLLAKIHTTLEPLLGEGRFRAGVSVDVDFTSGEQSDESYDPERSVVISSQKTEDLKEAGSADGIPGTASNLPRPTSRPGTSTQGYARRTEQVTYQPSRTVRRIRLPLGSVKRMSVALLVDHTVRWDGAEGSEKRIVEPVSPERLKVIRDLVAGAVGLVPDRGDQLIVETLPFESTLSWERPPVEAAPPPPAAEWPPWVPDWLKQWLAPLGRPETALLIVGAGGGLLLLLLLTLVFKLFRRRRVAAPAMAPALPAATSGDELATGGPVITGELQKKLAEQAALKERQTAEALSALKLPPVATQRAEVLTKHLTDEAKKDPVNVSKLMRTWIQDRDR